MLPQVIPHPPNLNPLPVPEHSLQFSSRSKLASDDDSCFNSTIPNFAFLSVSPSQSVSSADTVDDDRIPSPTSPLANTGNYHYDSCGPASFNSVLPSSEMYDNSAPYPASSPSFASVQHSHHAFTDIDSGATAKDSRPVGSYLSDSPSPVDTARPTTFPHPFSAPHTQERFLHSVHQPYTEDSDRLDQSDTLPDRYSRLDKYSAGSHSQPPLLDQRRMSEPAILGSANMYATSTIDTGRYEQFNHTYNHSMSSSSRIPSSMYVPPLHRGASIGSLRDLRQSHAGYPSHSSTWKQNQDRMPSFSSTSIDEPISPLQPNFSGGLMGSPTSGVPYSPGAENLYGPSPPGTGTSTSSNPPLGLSFNPASSQPSMGVQRSSSIDQSPNATNKTYSFVALPGNAIKKRPRRRYDEIERLYQCSWPDCTKAYGTLNHLNAHVTMQKHGSKRSPNEFKELRKQWRKAKKESDASANSLRRAHMSSRSDDHLYGMQRYSSGGSASVHQASQHAASGLSSLSIPQQGTGQRYSVSIDDIRYPVHERDDLVANYGHMSARQRYSTGLPSSWHPGSSLPTRHESYMSAGGINQSHPSQPSGPLPINSLHPPTHTQGRPPSPSQSQMQGPDRLPPDSTLFTPLPGYQPPSLLPPLQHGSDLAYGYKMYDEESNGRPGTGHASLGPASGDEYDR